MYLRLLVTLVAYVNIIPPTAGSDGNNICSFDDRTGSLRCLGGEGGLASRGGGGGGAEIDTQWDIVRASLTDLITGGEGSARKVASIVVSFCNVVTLPPFALSTNANQTLHLAHIRRVAVSNCGLMSVSQGALDGVEETLEHLDLSGNRLSSLPPQSVLDQLTGLVSLDLSGNLIKQLPHGSAFNNLNALVRLDLSLNLLGYEMENSFNLATGSEKRLVHQPLNLLTFNLEPLTDTLEELYLRDNGFKSLPKQLQERQFASLRILDVSKNPLGALPRYAFAGMKQLEMLNLEHTGLQHMSLSSESDADEDPSFSYLQQSHLKELRLLGNPLQCDCNSRWLWNLARSNESSRIRIGLPKCATPFSVRNAELSDLRDSDLCDVLSSKRVPRFFRVSDQDRSSFPPLTFESLTLTSVIPAHSSTTTRLNVTWHLKIDFYFSEYDWALILREIGGRDGGETPGMFYKTDYDLAKHIESNAAWTPKNETISTRLEGLLPDIYYEVCLAAVDRGTIYYIHRNNCREVRTPLVSGDANISISTDSTSVTVTWQRVQPAPKTISLRQFSFDNTTLMHILDDFNQTTANGSLYYVVPHLLPSTAYLVCVDYSGEKGTDGNVLSSSSSERPRTSAAAEATSFRRNVDVEFRASSSRTCREVLTQSQSSDSPWAAEAFFPVKEVAAASAVSTTTTVFVVALICCCCYPGCCRKKKKKKKKKVKDEGDKKGLTVEGAAVAEEDTKDENDNHQMKSDDDEVEGEEEDNEEEEEEEEERSDTALKRNEDDNDIEVSSGQFRATIISENGGLVSNGSYFHNRYSTAKPSDTVPRREGDGSGGNRRFWQSCLSNPSMDAAATAVPAPSANSSLYSQYDYTVHSEATQDRHRSSSFSGKKERHSSRRQKHIRNASPPPDVDIHSHHRRKRLRSGSRAEDNHPVVSRAPDGDDHQAFLYEPYLANLGSGNYHTISHFQFYRRPHQPPAIVTLPPPPPSHYAYYPHFRIVPPPSLDYARTLGRRRRESPMAMMPPPLPPQPPLTQQSQPSVAAAFELKPLSLKRIRNRSKIKSENYKMYTWSPYSSGLFYSERMAAAAAAAEAPRSIAAVTADYPYQLREPFLGRKRVDELLF